MKEIIKKIGNKFRSACIKTDEVVEDTKGEIATSTIGGIIAGVVVVGLLVVAVNAAFPTFFSSMFTSMQTKLNANWS
jgi:hypothetical protein